MYEKLRPFFQHIPTKRKLAVLLLAAYIFSPLAYYGIPEKYYDITSPSGAYRIDFYIPQYCPYAFFAYRKPFFIKIYDNVKKRYVYTSKIDTKYARWATSWPEEVGRFSVSYGISVTLDQLQ